MCTWRFLLHRSFCFYVKYCKIFAFYCILLLISITAVTMTSWILDAKVFYWFFIMLLNGWDCNTLPNLTTDKLPYWTVIDFKTEQNMFFLLRIQECYVSFSYFKGIIHFALQSTMNVTLFSTIFLAVHWGHFYLQFVNRKNHPNSLSGKMCLC